MSRDWFQIAHEKLVEEYLELHPDATDDEAYDKTADKAYDRMRDMMIDAAESYAEGDR